MRRTVFVIAAGLVMTAPFAEAGWHALTQRAALLGCARTFVESAGLHIGHIALDPWTATLHVDALALATPALSVHVAKLTLAPAPIASAAIAPAHAETGGATAKPVAGSTISAENIVIDSTDATYTIPHIEATGTDLSADGLKALFDIHNPKPLNERLGQLSAATVTIPEIDVALKGPQTKGQMIYRNVRLNNVVKAHVSDGTMQSLTGTLVSPDADTIDIACGAEKTKDFDIVQNLRIMSETTKETEVPRLLYGDLAIQDCKFDFDKSQRIVEVGTIHLSAVKGRPPLQSLKPAQTTSERDQQNPDDPELIEKRRAYLTYLFGSFEAGALDASNLRASRHRPDGGADKMALAKLSLTNFAASKLGELRFEDLTVTTDHGTMKIAAIDTQGIDLANLSKVLTRKSNDSIASLPLLDRLDLQGFDVDSLDHATDTPSHLRFQVAKFAMSSTRTDADMPSRFTATLDHFTAGIGTLKSTDFADIAGMGYDKLDLSGQLALNFDAGKQELGLDDFSLTGTDMGTVKLSGQFSQASEDLFSSDEAIAEAALLATSINRVELKIDNVGLVDRIIAAAAKKEGKSPDEIRRNYVAAVSVGVPAYLDNGPGAKAIGAALAKFIASPKTFHLVARAPNGLGASDLFAITEPGALMDKLEIHATADSD